MKPKEKQNIPPKPECRLIWKWMWEDARIRKNLWKNGELTLLGKVFAFIWRENSREDSKELAKYFPPEIKGGKYLMDPKDFKVHYTSTFFGRCPKMLINFDDLVQEAGVTRQHIRRVVNYLTEVGILQAVGKPVRAWGTIYACGYWTRDETIFCRGIFFLNKRDHKKALQEFKWQ